MSNCWSFSLRIVLSVFASLTSCCLPALAQQSSLDTVAQRLAEELQKDQKKHFFPKVLVTDFSLQPAGINALGDSLANQFSDVLAQKIGTGFVIERKTLHDYLLSHGISPLDLADPEIALWIASQVGANAIVFGRLKTSEDNLVLSAELTRIGDGKRLGSSTTEFPLSKEFKELIQEPIDWTPSQDVVVSCLSSDATNVIKAAFKAAGVTEPTCVHCPSPEYTDEARRTKAQGTVKLEVVVDEEGRAKRVTTVKGDNFGFANKAIDVIKKWKFNPATKDGKPVPVCILAEVTFRLY